MGFWCCCRNDRNRNRSNRSNSSSSSSHDNDDDNNSPPPPPLQSSLGCCSQQRFLLSSSSFPAALGLLQFPLDYVFTVNHSSLWQKHVAWAKPDGAELKAYITQSYSSFSVLLSLLLATTTAVFFHSSPELVELRHHLLQHDIWELKFWIGFLLLANIMVALLGLLVTATTWGMISAIGDNNAHCLLRSTTGAYVTSLPPRLVMASLYLFLIWFSLFVVELVAIGPAIVLLGFIAVLFFSIVPSLSVFGRLIMYTGAMSSQRPVLAEEFQKELLPTGLQASLLIRAHVSRHRNWSVMNQYNRRWRRHQQQQQQQQQAFDGERREQHGGENNEQTRRPNGEVSRHFHSSSDGTMFASVAGLDENDGRENNINSNINIEQNNASLVFTSQDATMADVMKRVVENPTQGKFRTPLDEPLEKTNQQPQQQEQQQNHHRRTETADTTLFLPPAAILNLSMSGKQFKELIDNTIDTSSLGGYEQIGRAKPELGTAAVIDLAIPNGNGEPSSPNVDETKKTGGPNAVSFSHNQRSPHYMTTNRPLSSTSNLISNNYGRPPTLSARATSAPPIGSNGLPPSYAMSPNMTTAATRHHRRVSSSRFVMDEWAQESSVRDLYGVQPPPDLPREITLIDETMEQTEEPLVQQSSRHSSLSWSPGRGFRNYRHPPATNTFDSTNTDLLISPFPLDDSRRETRLPLRKFGRLPDYEDGPSKPPEHNPLTQPLIPRLDAGVDNGNAGQHDEEAVGSLLGEDLLPETAQRRKVVRSSLRNK